MKLHLIAVGTKMPDWVSTGYSEYAKRFPRDCALELIEIPSRFRGRNSDTKRLLEQEGQALLAAVPRGARVVVLDPQGTHHTTEGLARKLDGWRQGGTDVAMLVGGPEGLSQACLKAAHERWSLSKLTLPHPLVRVVVAEALYRAWSVTVGHPYHRA